ncbi:response regulator [Alloalcanivorax mobilis]|uniref:response regulator n=1 Tax=Alloalcanivorax mobilis TaxID=2019569 RepID=UPI000C75A555|nr:response regulator transcription factor [Alloalcanivorax mobilis]
MHVLVVDDHQLFLDGIRHLLMRLEQTVRITEATQADAAMRALEAGAEFDLVLIDLCMPGMDGLAVLRGINERKLRLPVVVVSGEQDPYRIRAVLDQGALGFIPKSVGGEEMLAALRSVLDGDIYLPPRLEQQISRLGTRRPPDEAFDNPALRECGITKRQYQVLTLMAEGYSNKQIADTLFLTEHTVKSHVASLFAILMASNRTGCVQNAVKRGVLTLEHGAQPEAGPRGR